MPVTGCDQSRARDMKRKRKDGGEMGSYISSIASLGMPWTDNPYGNECLHVQPMLIMQDEDPSQVESVKGLRSVLFLFNHIRMNERA